MRTDGVQMAGEAIGEARHVIGENYGARYVPEAPRAYSSRAKNAQEAHEAIRPTSFSRRPEQLFAQPRTRSCALYELIWKRALASQMQSAELERTTIDSVSDDRKNHAARYRHGDAVPMDFSPSIRRARTTKTRRTAPGFQSSQKNDRLEIEKISPAQHFTEPPPRYSEASLVRKLEELGIGRPSTYATILSVLRERAYVRDGSRTFRARGQRPHCHELPQKLLQPLRPI